MDEQHFDLDGLGLPPDVSDRVNRLANHVFGTQQGQDFLAYLKNVAMNRPRGPGIDGDTALHLEGQRWIVALIMKRVQLGEGPPNAMEASDIEPAPTPRKRRGRRK